MTDMQAHLAKIRSDAAECLLLGSLVPDDKRPMFVKISEHLNTLAFEIERTMAISGSKPAVVAPQPEVVGQAIAADHEVAGADLAVAAQPQARRPRRMLLWLLAIVVGMGAFFWITPRVENYSALFTAPLKSEQLPVPQEEANRMMARAPVEQGDRLLQEQMGALLARMDNLQKALDSLKSSEAVEGSNKQSTGAAQRADNAPPLPTLEGSPRRDGNGLLIPPASSGPSTLPNSDSAKPSVLAPTGGNPHIEEPDQVGSIGGPGGTELDQRRASGPVGCMHFRSFDPISGTYFTFDGRRRPCR